MKNNFLTLLFFFTSAIAQGQASCSYFKQKYENAKSNDNLRKASDRNLEQNQIFQGVNDLGYARITAVPCRNSTEVKWYDNWEVDVLTETARLIAEANSADLVTFENNFDCLLDYNNTYKKVTTYRSINGYGNNLKNPYWGSTGAPFSRFGSKNYNDGVHEVQKSVSGNDLPSPRRLVQNVLMKAQKFQRQSKLPNDMANFAGIYLTHDIAHHQSVELPTEKCQDMRCCTTENKNLLTKDSSYSACLPITIDNNDPFYKLHDVRCLTFIRSDQSSLPNKLQFGEIKNKETSYLDLSLVYGVEERETREIRTFLGGQLNQNSKNLLATNAKDKYTRISDRFRPVPATSVWPSLFIRNHNKMADELARLNPKWSDEKLYHEARRINIAILQKIIYYDANFLFESEDGLKINEDYDPNVDTSSMVEFHSAAFRYFHFYVNSNVKLITNNGQESYISYSDMFGKLETVEDNFDSIVNGFFRQSLNFGEYSEELTNKFAKNNDSIGIDVISFDIQRGRDHGVPSFLQTREKCGLKSDFKKFKDLLQIFPKSYVELLQKEFESVEDIDLIVGGSLESFLSVNSSLVGETFDCIIRSQMKKLMAGDIYFFTNPKSPYPFKQSQIKAIKEFSFNHLVCLNSGVELVPKSSFYVVDGADNPEISCSQFKPINLEPWKIAKND